MISQLAGQMKCAMTTSCRVHTINLTFKIWFIEMPIIGRRMSPAAFVAIVMFFWTMSSALMSIERAVWFETGSSKISANSDNWGLIFCVNVCSRAFVWFRTDETKLSTFLPAVSTSEKPLCRSSLPYKPENVWWNKRKYPFVVTQKFSLIFNWLQCLPNPIAPQHNTGEWQSGKYWVESFHSCSRNWMDENDTYMLRSRVWLLN